MRAKRDPMQHPLIVAMRRDGSDIDYIRTDDIGDYYVTWLERTTENGGPAGIWFYIDEAKGKVMVERIGSPP